MAEDTKEVKFDDINYAVYRIGKWDNEYQINQIGISDEIPVNQTTLDHVKLSMDEIRRAEFEIGDTTVNGFVAIAFQLNPKIQKMDLKEAIELEQKEYDSIIDELEKLELESDDKSISLDDENYLVYKLEKECHVTKSVPANEHTLKHHAEEIKRIEDSII